MTLNFCDFCGRSGAPITILTGPYAPYFFCGNECQQQLAVIATNRAMLGVAIVADEAPIPVGNLDANGDAA